MALFLKQVWAEPVSMGLAYQASISIDAGLAEFHHNLHVTRFGNSLTQMQRTV